MGGFGGMAGGLGGVRDSYRPSVTPSRSIEQVAADGGDEIILFVGRGRVGDSRDVIRHGLRVLVAERVERGADVADRRDRRGAGGAACARGRGGSAGARDVPQLTHTDDS